MSTPEPHEFGTPGSPGSTSQTTGAAAFREVQDSAEFAELRSRFRRFAFPLGAAFLIWYFAYVLLSTYAVDFMTTRVIGNITIGVILGLLQFVTTFGITWLYIRHANKNLDPIAAKVRDDLEGRI
ncbi:DUF485 domain-containing protein [Aestuariimicrobium ganziense]|uniref:DUF485 domain-containing protein n=1 Tax=Aestuariimicrobium ganziense TaxID=2773677 RepID=UPI001942139A|nr:DUF485 domain-containing protein [Aestuariimicrobium ganziense]